MATPDVAETRSGWLTFAAVMLLAVGAARTISAISYFADSNDVNNLTNGLFGDNLLWWGIWDLVIAGLALWGGVSLLRRGFAGVYIAAIWAIVLIVQGFMTFSMAPWYSATAIAIGSVVTYGVSKELSKGNWGLS